MNQENMAYIQWSVVKKENPIICDNLDELGGLYAMWNKLDKHK